LVVFIEIFQHNQQYDTLLPIIPCTHKLKAGIAYSSASRPFAFVGITYYISKTWQNGCRQRKKVASREKFASGKSA
jgi:hypothetical protein